MKVMENNNPVVLTEALKSLMQDLRQIIEQARVHVAATANYVQTMVYWHIGERINRDVLGIQRAEYGRQIVSANIWSGDEGYLVQRACSFRPKDYSMKGFLFVAIEEPIKFFEKTLVGATVAHLGKNISIQSNCLFLATKSYSYHFRICLRRGN